MADNHHQAYGDYPAQDDREQNDRGLVNDTLQKTQRTPVVSSLLDKVQGAVQEFRSELNRVAGQGIGQSQPRQDQHRFDSFVGPQEGNAVKWYVDGAGYFWAVSIALQEARESIWILDWWLSPELYLRRPPAKHEQYRLDRLLRSAAERGVKVNVIVYKEVPQALTLDSQHTKHYLEGLHPNIAVFRHPDHLPDAHTLESSFVSSLQGLKLNAATASKLGGDALKTLYGFSDDIILYWAHHEKLCIVDGGTVFMGGLDLCYGRWDSNQHSIADAHPGDLNAIVFPGQDFNNARVMDFEDVSHWQNNKLDRKYSSRMGWSDISICVRGSVTQDLRQHFVQRWNFIYNEKYDLRKDVRYHRLSLEGFPVEQLDGQSLLRIQRQQGQSDVNRGYSNQTGPQPDQEQGLGYGNPDQNSTHRAGAQSYLQRLEHEVFQEGTAFKEHFQNQAHRMGDQLMDSGPSKYAGADGMYCQLVRSASKWSNGTATEHSIANAYASLIKQASHFIYIENQFFITATGNNQSPIKNNIIGSAIVERILRAARTGQKFKIIIVMPAIPGFAGDLQADASLGTRAIMEYINDRCVFTVNADSLRYQYKSINRGGHSIMEEVAKAGFDPLQYIRWYNLRNYDRINTSAVMEQAERNSGVDYEAARRDFDHQVDPLGYERSREAALHGAPKSGECQRYQHAADELTNRRGLRNWDSVSGCYMLHGPDIREIPWEGDQSEMDAFVQEELYIHSKVMIVDDRTVVCGSANCNDRSMLGYHDSEIALVVEDSEPLESFMDGQPWRASRFAATLRRQLSRKHLGLLPVQDFEKPDRNFEPLAIPNAYDLGSAEDHLVADPVADNFLNFWNGRARQNTEAFRKVFHPVPDDSVKTWAEYSTFFERYFTHAEEVAEGKGGKGCAKYRWGHVVAENFSPGEQGVREVKDILSTIHGTLVEMPLLFLIKEDIAKEGLSLNALTEEVYT